MPFLAPNASRAVSPGFVVVHQGNDVWALYQDNLVKGDIAIALTSAIPGNPFQLQSFGDVPVNVFNLGSGAATSVSISAGNTPSRGTNGTVVGICDASGRITVQSLTAVTPVSQVYYNVKNYQAVGDGVTDDTTAVLNTISACVQGGGGVVWFPAGTYLITPGAILLNALKGVSLQGASRSSTKLLCNGAGQILGTTGPTNHTNASFCDVLDLSLAWTSAANGVSGNIGVNLFGWLQSRFRLQISLPSNCNAIGFYGVTSGLGGGCFENTIDDPQISGNGAANSKGIYFQNAVSLDGGGCNSNIILGGFLSTLDIGWHCEHGFGNIWTGGEASNSTTANVVYGSLTHSGIGSNNNKAELRYSEGSYSHVYFADPESNNNRYIILNRPALAGNSHDSGVNDPGFVHSSSLPYMNNNTAQDFTGGIVGAQPARIQPSPYPDVLQLGAQQTRAGTLSGISALRIPNFGMIPTGGAASDIISWLRRLWLAMAQGGLVDPYTPSQFCSTGLQVVGYWRPEFGMTRTLGGKPPTWDDGTTNGYRFTSANQSTVYVENLFDQSAPSQVTVQPNIPIPWLQLPGNDYWTTTLNSGVTACTVMVTAQCVDLNTSNLEGFIELLPAGSPTTIDTGVALSFTGWGVVPSSAKLTARRLTDDAAIVYTPGNGYGIPSAWVCMVARFSNSGAGLWINGTKVGTSSNSVSLPTMTKVTLGGLAGGTGHLLNGGIAEVAIFSEDIGDSYAQALSKAGAWRIQSP